MQNKDLIDGGYLNTTRDIIKKLNDIMGTKIGTSKYLDGDGRVKELKINGLVKFAV